MIGITLPSYEGLSFTTLNGNPVSFFLFFHFFYIYFFIFYIIMLLNYYFIGLKEIQV